MQSSLMNEILEVRSRQLRKKILTTSIIAALSIILTILIIYWIIKKNNPGFGGVALLAAGSGVSVVYLVIALSATGKLLIGPAKGAHKPVKALKKFYTNVLVSRGTIFNKVQADAMFFIHPNSVETIGGWKLFQAYWNNVNDQIYSQLIKKCKNTPTGTSVKLSVIWRINRTF